MKNREVSLRGKLVRDMMKNMMDSAMGHKIQTGEYLEGSEGTGLDLPPDYEYEIVEMPHFKMEYLRAYRSLYRKSDSAASWGRLHWPYEKYLPGFRDSVLPQELWRGCADH